MRLAPPRKLGHVGVLEAVDGTVLMTAEGVHIYLATVPPVAAPFASRVSAAHHVGTDEHWQASLMGLLQSRQQTQLAALLEVRSVRHTEWFAEHARAQLDPKGRCSSKPAWVAWCASWASLEDGGDEETLFVALWAEEGGNAARRAVDALHLGAAAATTHVMLDRSLLPQLERRAFERSDLELLVDLSESKAVGVDLCSGCDDESWDALPEPLGTLHRGKAWASLIVRSGSELEDLEVSRAAVAERYDELADKMQQSFRKELLAQDPNAHVSIEKVLGGKYMIKELIFNGHAFDANLCKVCINPFSDVSDIIKTVTYRCNCC